MDTLYCICKLLPIYSKSPIFAHKSRYASFLHGVFGNPSGYFVCDLVTQILGTVPYDTQSSDCIKQGAIFKPLRIRLNKSANDVTFAPKFCVVSRWLPANKSVAFY